MMRRKVIQGDPVDPSTPHDGDRVVRKTQPVDLLGPTTHQDPDRGTGPGQRNQHQVGATFGEHEFGDRADGASESPGGLGQHLIEEGLIVRVGLVLDRQRLSVMRATGLDLRLPLPEVTLQIQVGQIGQQPGHLIRVIAAKIGSPQGFG
jgi:hypothetical protein